MRLLRLLLLPLLVASGLVLVVQGPAQACSCVPGGPRTFVSGADVVLVGTVTDVAPPPERAVMSSGDPVVYTLRVESVLKGRSGATARVVSAMSSASCGLAGVRTGRDYLVFASRTRGEPAGLAASLCGGTAPLTSGFLERVEAITGPGRPPAAAPDPVSDAQAGSAEDQMAAPLSDEGGPTAMPGIEWLLPAGLLAVGGAAGWLLLRRRLARA